MTERKLAAILSADVVGYSRLMAEDQDATVHIVSDYREQVELLVRQHRGRLVDFTGDNFLAEFPTAFDAVQSAIEIQRVLASRNADLAAERKMEFRIGIHLGDIRVEGERIFGDGVNVAARLESLAAAGGICISATVREQVRNRLKVGYEDLGDQEIKNVPERVHVYRVRTDLEGEAAWPAPSLRRRVALWTGTPLVVAALALGGWWVLSQDRSRVAPEVAPDSEPDREAAGLTVPGFGSRPAIAVLPFDNLSADPEQEYFADGIAEDLITRLSHWRGFPVISRNSSFAYKGKAVDIKDVSRSLGARYVVEGSVRRANDQVRITAQLIDASTGHHVWAERYDGELSDIFALQDKITEAIVASMHPQLQRFETERVARQEPRNIDAYDLAMRGAWHYNRMTREDNEKARRLLERAVELDPYLAAAYSSLAMTHTNDVWFQWATSPDRSASDSLRMAQRGVALDAQSSSGHVALAGAYSLIDDRDRTIAAAERAIQLNPSSAQALSALGGAQGVSGRPEEAIRNLAKAQRLSPRDPRMWSFLDGLAHAHFAAGRYEEAGDFAQQVLQQKPDYSFGHFLIAATRAHQGRLDEARTALADGLRLQPEFSQAAVDRMFGWGDPSFLEPYLDGLRRAGLKE